jgi:hypothetical protein
MTKNHAYERRIRARMAVTGEPCSVAMRALADGRPGYWRSAWFNSGWKRLLPCRPLGWEIAVTTATVHGVHSSLEVVLADSPASIDLAVAGEPS